MNTKTKSILIRFAKGAISSAISAMSLVSLTVPTAWSDVSSMLTTLTFAGIFGGITGFLMAAEKWASWKN